MGCCLFAVLLAGAPRLAFIIWWLVQPARIAATFNQSFIVPVLGVLFVPWTTVMYTLVYHPGGLSIFEWILVGIALLIDIGSYTGGGVANSRRTATA
jgi:hypothetical protein